MRSTISLFAFIISMVLCVSITVAGPAEETWVKLGSKKTNNQIERDTLNIGVAKGTFTKLKLQIKGASLNTTQVVVEYGNGMKDTIPLQHTFSRKSNTKIINLKDGTRAVKRITFQYNNHGNARRQRAVVSIWGTN